MLNLTAVKPRRSTAVLLLTGIGCALVASAQVQAQEPRPGSDVPPAAQEGKAMQGIEKSDIRRGRTQVGDVDGDGLADAANARQADLKKLADELVNSHRPTGGHDGHGAHATATKVDAGNALNAGSASARAGDPIPGIDITVSRDGENSSVQAGSSPHDAEPVPALDANPNL